MTRENNTANKNDNSISSINNVSKHSFEELDKNEIN